MKKSLLLLVIAFSAALPLGTTAAEVTWTPTGMNFGQPEGNPETDGVWGQVRHFTDHRIALEDGQEFRFSKNVLIDVENLAIDVRGNVRILLDASGKAKAVFFNGIDMPEVMSRFKK